MHYREGPGGLSINYDPRLREAFLAAFDAPPPDLWPLFDALAGLPLALIRGANSDLLSAATAAEMRRRRPDMLFADVPDRGHVPFLDEPEALAVIRAWLERLE
jgi:pimeloyl-ACP methyl ester carboxylesterase